MKLHSLRTAFFLTASIGGISRLALAAPVVSILQVARSGDIAGNNSLATVDIDLEGETGITTRNEDDLGLGETYHGVGIETRMTIPRPPTPPKLPVPPPPPVPRPLPPVVIPKPKPADPVPVPGSPRPPPPPPKADWKPIPATENPGQGYGMGNDPKQMDEYAKAGKTQVDSYEATVHSNKPDVLTVGSKAELQGKGPNEAFLDIRKNPAYKIEEVKVLTSELKELKNFKSSELGFEIKQGFVTQVSVRNGKDPEPINQGIYDPNGNYIMYQVAFKDGNNVADKIPLNEIGMQNFQKVAGDNTKNFKAAFLMELQNKEFWGITRQNYNDMKQPFSEVMTFNRGTPQFERYMGSPNINSKFFSYGNHHNAIGNKIVDKIVIIPKQAENSGGKFTAALIFKNA
ncbi:hypothetical protein JX265_007219 [Neoarthrinium moseri]|uniref:Uncharacterized protein n=1 Tax=Neoarthrinium moseri TaxID=1658444 RepID=A0A9P9WKY3_9PEZI|nr:hypothetical protein JX265_007219 [Neoarthrinium moseri]